MVVTLFDLFGGRQGIDRLQIDFDLTVFLRAQRHSQRVVAVEAVLQWIDAVEER